MGRANDKQETKSEASAARRARIEQERERDKSSIADALGQYDSAVAYAFSDGSGISIRSISVTLRENGRWRVVVTEDGSGERMVAFSEILHPVFLLERLPVIIERAEWQESKY